MTATRELNDFPFVLDEAETGVIEALPDNEPQLVALADRLLADLDATRKEREANAAACKVEVQRIQDRWAVTNIPLDRKEGRLLSMLEQIGKLLPLRGKKSRALATGTIGWRTVKPRLEVENEDATLNWIRGLEVGLRAHLLRVVTTEKIDKKNLDAHCLTTGELPPGCQLVDGREAFYANAELRSPE